MDVTPTRVWFTGLMGAGKTTVGRKVAAELGWEFLDNDTELARRTGKALREWAPGDELHAAEDETLHAMVTTDPPFVAGVAAGAADRPGLLAAVQGSGVLVHLQASPHVLEARVEGTGRPLGPDVRATLEAQFAHRDPIYCEAADLVLDAHEDPDELAGKVLAFLASEKPAGERR